ncbi:MAG TPA: sigma 54-interacting transcriptional regulator [Pyrinomonadaceae bacterium]|nr:sigma 54-interacting transcriptional regulator [Pyrinomonadaceae bacterium]
MNIALLTSDSIPLDTISKMIREEEVDVTFSKVDAKSTSTLPRDATLYFLIFEGQEIVRIGETTSRVRRLLNGETILVLCMPLPLERGALIEMGANDIITPASMTVAPIAERILAHLISLNQVKTNNHGDLRGGTRVMRDVYRHIETLGPLADSVLILGETGTGKELVAREMHRTSSRTDPYLAVNCAELNPELLGSELFGHEKGAFTNAIQSRRGLLAEAEKGTVFLDEIGDLDLQAQAKLLRVLEEKKIRRIGANKWEDVSARILLATHRNLEADCESGRFRRDLYERIRGFTIDLPPLRTRKADIPLLVDHFINTFRSEYKHELKLPAGAVDQLFRYDWPGNVRELRAAVRKAAAYADDEGNISSLILQESTRGRKAIEVTNAVSFNPSTDTWREVQKNTQAAYFKALLAEAKGDRELAIKLSGLSKTQFYEKLKESKIL